jgi:hypothetical protein
MPVLVTGAGRADVDAGRALPVEDAQTPAHNDASIALASRRRMR